MDIILSWNGNIELMADSHAIVMGYLGEIYPEVRICLQTRGVNPKTFTKWQHVLYQWNIFLINLYKRYRYNKEFPNVSMAYRPWISQLVPPDKGSGVTLSASSNR
jgi:hypothetical protein